MYEYKIHIACRNKKNEKAEKYVANHKNKCIQNESGRAAAQAGKLKLQGDEFGCFDVFGFLIHKQSPCCLNCAILRIIKIHFLILPYK